MCCVYFHRHPSTNEIVYIGHGTVSRAYNKSYRNKKWAEFIKEYPNYVIEIYKDNLDKEEAFNIESELILRELPLLNYKIKQTLRSVIDFDKMSSLFYVDPSSETGLSHKVPNNARNLVNKKNTGNPAGSVKYQTDGRPHAWQIMTGGKSYLVHRIIWILSGNTLDVDTVIDHIDRNPFNNKIENLREATCKENVANSKLRCTSKTGIRNLLYRTGRYTVYTYLDGVRSTKSYSVSKYGYDEAKRLALEYLETHN